MGKAFDGLHGLKGFGFDIIALIADGRKETITKIEDETCNGRIVNYIYSKHSDRMMLTIDESCPYDIENWNKQFSDYSGWVEGNESRKFGITNEDDGLLLLLGLLMDMLEEPKQ